MESVYPSRSHRVCLLFALVLAVAVSLVSISAASASPLDQPQAPTMGKDDGLKPSAGGTALIWQDNSTDEQGFRIRVTFRPSGETYDFTAPANATEFRFPSSLPLSYTSVAECLRRQAIIVEVRAYNASGESAPTSTAVERECADAPGELPPAGEPDSALALAAVAGAVLTYAGLRLRRH